MWRPSATSAIETNIHPPAISAAIIRPHSAMTPRARRSLRAWPAPRKTWLCRNSSAASLRALMRGSSLEVGVHHFDQLLGRPRVERYRVLLRADQVTAHVVLDHLRHQAGNRTAD